MIHVCPEVYTNDACYPRSSDCGFNRSNCAGLQWIVGCSGKVCINQIINQFQFQIYVGLILL